MTDTAAQLAKEKIELEQRLASINLINTQGRTVEELIELETTKIETEKALFSVLARIHIFIYSSSENSGGS